jgi:hypothetical protein
MLTDTQQLAELLDAKHGCLLELRDLGRAQSQWIAGGDVAHLLRTLAEKQQLIERLTRIERLLDPFRDQDPQSRVWRSADERGRCAKLIETSQALLDEILQQEKRNEAELQLKRDEVAARLQNLNVTRNARHAYAEQATADASHLDFDS